MGFGAQLGETVQFPASFTFHFTVRDGEREKSSRVNHQRAATVVLKFWFIAERKSWFLGRLHHHACGLSFVCYASCNYL